MPILEVKNLYYKYASCENYVINNQSMQFEKGFSYAFLGKSGCGKTTLLSLLAGLDVSQKGAILYKGKDLNTINRDDYRAQKIGIVFQQFNLLHKYTAVENIMIAMEISKFNTENNKKYVENLLNSIGIVGDKQTRKITKLSGGEQQRVALARAICHKPKIIIADEPTANLDEENQNMIINILTNFTKNENCCLIMATHSQEVASATDYQYNL